MPTHWESSTRPLFVKTVVVNGSRHAILTQEDPLGQPSVSNKCSRPNSPQGSSSGDSNVAQNSNDKTDSAGKKGKNRQPLDLQGCLVKLRVVLATHQDTRRHSCNPLKPPNGPVHKKRRHYLKKSASLDKKDELLPGIPPTSPKAHPMVTHQLSIDQSVAVANFFTEPKFITVNDNEERISGNSNEWNRKIDTDAGSTAPFLGMSTDYDVPWNTVPADNYFTRPFYNRLSERVLQWLDLSARTNRKTESDESSTQRQENKTSSTPVPRRAMHRRSSEDNSDEVRTDEDVETALSMEVPKFSQELNRRHKINLTSPPPQEDTPLPILQAETYNSFTNIRTGKCALPPKMESLLQPRVKRRGHLTKQVRLEDSSDEETKLNLSNFWNFPEEATGSIHDGGLWSGRSEGRLRTSRDGKPQLHIFMPSIPQEEQLSDAESESIKGEAVQYAGLEEES